VLIIGSGVLAGLSASQLALARSQADEAGSREQPVDGGERRRVPHPTKMHLSEFAVRDFLNVERHLAPWGVTVFDDILPRNALEAARVRRTGAWAGDVYKAVEVIARHRPDLQVVLINTWPTGTAIVVGSDPASEVLQEAYLAELPYLEGQDPQRPPPAYMSRSAAVDPADLLASEAWSLLVAARESHDATSVEKAKDVLQSIPTLG